MWCARLFACIAALALAPALAAVDLSEYDKAIRENPQDFLAYYKRATANLLSNRDVQALSDLRSALELNPKFEPALFYRARTNLRLGNSERARADAAACDAERCQELLTQAAEFDERAAAAAAEQAAGEWADCITEAGAALAVAPKAAALRRRRFECYMSAGETVLALADLKEVVNLDKRDSNAVVMLAKAEFLLNNNKDLALQILRRCITLDPDSPTCVATSKQLRLLSKELAKPALKIDYRKLDKLVRSETTVMGLPPADAENSEMLNELRHRRCEAYCDAGAWEKGTKVCAIVRDVDPGFVPAKIVQAHMEKQRGNLEGAAHLCVEMIQEGVQDQRVVDLYQEIQAERAQQQQRRQQRGSGGGVTSDKDLYKVLGVEKDADTKQIKKAYRELSKKYHPDKYKGKDLSEEDVLNKMAEINEAYEVLSHDDKRQEYDLASSGGGQAFGGQGFGGGGGGGGFGGADPNIILQHFAQQFAGQGGGNFKFRF